MSIQYQEPEFELTTLLLWVSSFNHYLDQDSRPKRIILGRGTQVHKRSGLSMHVCIKQCDQNKIAKCL